MRKFCFTINGTSFPAELEDNSITELLTELAPLELDCTRSGEHEYYADLPKKENVRGCAPTTQGRTNGIYYFDGWNALSLVFADCNTAPYKIYPIGEFTGDAAAALKAGNGNMKIRCELVKE